MPVVGFGTWRAYEGQAEASAYAALQVGYRHLDCARLYANEKEVGAGIARALQEGLLTREELFVTSKVWNDSHTRELTRSSVEGMLADLGLSYLDQVLIHWPVSWRVPNVRDEAGNSVEETDPTKASAKLAWGALEELVDEGKIRSIGVSNFTPAQIDELLTYARIRPDVNQVELHPYLQQDALLADAKSRGMLLTHYCPLANVHRPGFESLTALTEPIILALAEKHKRTPGQIILRWGVQHGNVVLPKSVTPERIKANLDIFDFELSEEDMAQIKELGKRQHRFVNPTSRTGGQKVFPENPAPAPVQPAAAS